MKVKIPVQRHTDDPDSSLTRRGMIIYSAIFLAVSKLILNPAIDVLTETHLQLALDVESIIPSSCVIQV